MGLKHRSAIKGEGRVEDRRKEGEKRREDTEIKEERRRGESWGGRGEKRHTRMFFLSINKT